MSKLFQVVEYLCKNSSVLKLNQTERNVLIVLTHRIGNNATCYWREREISSSCGIKERAFRNAIKKLSELKLINIGKKQNKKIRTNEYSLCIDFGNDRHEIASRDEVTTGTKLPVPPLTTGKMVPVTTGKMVPVPPVENQLQLIETIEEKDEIFAPKVTIEINNKKIKQTKSRKTDCIDPDLPDWLPEELWEKFIQFRIGKKKPLSSYGKELAIRKLNKFRSDGEDPIEIIEEAILRGWSGLFSVRSSNRSYGNAKSQLSPRARKLKEYWNDPLGTGGRPLCEDDFSAVFGKLSRTMVISSCR